MSEDVSHEGLRNGCRCLRCESCSTFEVQREGNPFKPFAFAVRPCFHDSPLRCDPSSSTPRIIAKELMLLQQQFIEAHEQQVQGLQRELLLASDAGLSGLASMGTMPQSLIQENAQRSEYLRRDACGEKEAPSSCHFFQSPEPSSTYLKELDRKDPVLHATEAVYLQLDEEQLRSGGEPEAEEAVTAREMKQPEEKNATVAEVSEPQPTKDVSQGHLLCSWQEEALEKGKARKTCNMDSGLQDQLRKIDTSQHYEHTRRGLSLVDRVHGITEHIYFDLSCGLVIVLNAVFMAYETEYALTEPAGAPSQPWMLVVGKTFSLFFVFELLLRMCGGVLRFFCTCNVWNYFDFFLVFLSVLEEVLQFASLSNARMIRLLRLTRTVKVFRMVRIVRLVSALRTLVNSLMGTIKQVIWAFFLIVCLMFIFGVIFGQVVSQARSNDPDVMQENGLQLHWGSVFRCMYTLYLSVSGGVSWIEAATPLESLGTGVFLGFIFYVALIQWVVLNVVTGCFCESASEAARKDVALAVAAHRSDRETFLQRCRAIFRSIDRDGSGQLEVDEMKPYLDSEPARALFAALDLDVGDVHELFDLLDEDGTAYIDLEEFMFGCLRLRGGAKALDIAKVQYQTTQISKKINALAAALQVKLTSAGGADS
eukprot:TRINITY_DN69363_c0_g1_i6.p1 TRINITY_DN69363_c0_g1~~TRINITY_DN69363_c0_g1_i6.p1  ORF type:complete len:651 (+),score=109.86 TRINITY_DN69363_c0_g1_i6:69-2021(+)